MLPLECREGKKIKTYLRRHYIICVAARNVTIRLPLQGETKVKFRQIAGFT